MPKKLSKAAQIADRRVKVGTLLKAAWSYREIADQLGCAVGTVAADAAALFAEWRAERQHIIETARALDLARLDSAIKAVFPAVVQGRLAAVDRLLSCLERRAKIFGYDSPIRQELGISGTLDVDATTDLHLLTDSQIEAMILELARREGISVEDLNVMTLEGEYASVEESDTALPAGGGTDEEA